MYVTVENASVTNPYEVHSHSLCLFCKHKLVGGYEADAALKVP